MGANRGGRALAGIVAACALAVAARAQVPGEGPPVPATHETPPRAEIEFAGMERVRVPQNVPPPPVLPEFVAEAAEERGVLQAVWGPQAEQQPPPAGGRQDPGAARQPPQQGPGQQAPLVNISLQDFARIVQGVTRRTFVWSQADGLNGVTFDLHSGQEIRDPDVLFELFQAICHMLGYAVVEVSVGTQRIYEIRKRDAIQGLPLGRTIEVVAGREEPIPETSGLVAMDYELKYISPQDAQNVIQNMLTQNVGNYIVPISTANRIVVVDTGHNLRRIKAILDSLDVPAPQVRQEVVTLQYARVDEVLPLVERYVEIVMERPEVAGTQPGARPGQPTPPAGAPGQGGPAPTTSQGVRAGGPLRRLEVQADPRTNTLFLYSTHTELLEQLKQLLAQVDRPAPALLRVYTRRINYARVSDIVDTLKVVMAGQTVGMGHSEEEKTIQPGQTGGGTTTTGGTSQTSGTPSGNVFRFHLQDQRPLPAGGGAEQPDLFRRRALNPVVVGDDPTSSVIVLADPDSIAYIDQLISHLDVRRPQVYLKAHLVEVQANRDFDLGVELARLKNAREGTVEWELATQLGLTRITLDPTTGVAVVPAVPQGLLFFLAKDRITNIPLFLQAFEGVESVRVLEEPEVVARDNEQAELSVRQEVPRFDTIFQGTSPVLVFRDFIPAPTRLTIVPRITDHESINLQIDLEVSRFIQGTGDTGRGIPPAKFSRQLRSNITVPNGYTAAIGGLITGDERETTRGVPVLKDIPVLGFLFRRETENTRKTVMYIFVTPEIMSDFAFGDFRRETQRRMDRLEAQGHRSEDWRREPPPPPRLESQFRVFQLPPR